MRLKCDWQKCEIIIYNNQTIWAPVGHEKTNNVVSDQVWNKPGCTATGDGERLEILYLGSRGIVLSNGSENKGADQLRGYLRLCFRICKTLVFSRQRRWTHMVHGTCIYRACLENLDMSFYNFIIRLHQLPLFKSTFYNAFVKTELTICILFKLTMCDIMWPLTPMPWESFQCTKGSWTKSLTC